MLYGKLLLLNKIKGPVILAASDPSVGFKTGIIIWRFFIKYVCVHTLLGASQVALMVKNSPANAGDKRTTDSIPGSGRSPGGGHGNPHQCSCPENPMDRGAWRAIVHGVAKSQTWLKRLSVHTCPHKVPTD